MNRQDLELLIGLQDWILDGETDSNICTGKKFNANWLFVVKCLDRVPLERLHDRLMDINPEVEYKFNITTGLYNNLMEEIDKERMRIIELEDIAKIVSNIEMQEERPLKDLSIADLLALNTNFQHCMNPESMRICKDVHKEFTKRLNELGYEKIY